MMTSEAEVLRVRMAPSPTGPIHLGNVHTALFNWLFARQRGGTFVLRFEDTDAARSERRWEQVIYDELTWLGMDWDEAPDCDGPYAPYRQSERLDHYREWAERLLKAGAAYECYCSVEEIEAHRQAANAAGRPYQYDRRCRNLTAVEREAACRQCASPPALRFAVPDDYVVVVEDIVRGRIEFLTSAIGDPVIVRPNGMPLYNFAVVVDDLTMKITHVLRGEGHISNTPLQVLIYEALGEPLPAFGHFGHITSGTGSKFSKRRGEGYIGHYRDMGILPEAMFNYLALLAWTPGGDREILTPAEVMEEFAIGRVSASPSQFDLAKLHWINGHHIRRLTMEELTRKSLPFLVEAGYVQPELDAAVRRKVEGILALEQPRVEALGQLRQAVSYYFESAIGYTEQAVKLIERPGVREDLQLSHDRLAAVESWDIPSLESAGAALLGELGKSAKAVYQPIRAAITGRTASPPIFDTLQWIGRDWALARMAHAASGLPLPPVAPAETDGAPEN